jgi:outer membrane murein-binding lipoprotein Lpp
MKMPDHSDIQELSARIDALAQELRAGRRPEAKARASKKSAKPKA